MQAGEEARCPHKQPGKRTVHALLLFGRAQQAQDFRGQPRIPRHHDHIDADHRRAEDHVVADFYSLTGACTAAMDDALAHRLQPGFQIFGQMRHPHQIAVGWRAAFVWLGLGWGGITFLVAVLFFRCKPKQSSQSHNPMRFGQTLFLLKKDQLFLLVIVANILINFIYAHADSSLIQYLTRANFPELVSLIAALGILNSLVIVTCQFPLLRLLSGWPVVKRIYLGIVLLALLCYGIVQLLMYHQYRKVSEQQIVAQVTLPAIQVASYLPIRLEFPVLADSASGEYELRVFGRSLDARPPAGKHCLLCEALPRPRPRAGRFARGPAGGRTRPGHPAGRRRRPRRLQRAGGASRPGPARQRHAASRRAVNGSTS